MRGPENSERKGYVHLWPVWVVVGFPLLEIALEATPLAPNFAFVMLGLPTLWLMWAISALCAAILTIRWLWRRDWRRAGIYIVLPLVVSWAGLNSLTYIRFCNNTGDAIQFYARYPTYENAVQTTVATGEPKLVVFNLGGMSWASRGFVYDESDQILVEPPLQSPDWKARAQGSELSCGYGAIPMPGPSRFARHWYIASFPC